MKSGKDGGRLADFFKTEYSRLVGFARSLIDDAADRDGEDIVQDVMLGVLGAADVTAPVADLSAYVYRALRNRIIDVLRRGKGDISLDAGSPEGGTATLKDLLGDTRYDAAAETEKREIRRKLFEAVDSLGEEARAIIVMTELEGRSFREISGELDVPVGTLLARKSRAMKKLRERLAGLITLE